MTGKKIRCVQLKFVPLPRAVTDKDLDDLFTVTMVTVSTTHNFFRG